MLDRSTDLAAALTQLADLVERIDPVGTGRAAADVVVDRATSTLESLRHLADAASGLTTLVDRVHRLLDDVEEPLRMLLPQLAKAAGSMDRAGDVVVALTDLARRLGPLSVLLGADRGSVPARTAESEAD